MLLNREIHETIESNRTLYQSMGRTVLAAAFILLLPLLAMQFSEEVVWNLTDFVVAGFLLVATGLTYELVVKKAGNLVFRAGVGVMLAAMLLLVWTNLAVGIIGTENNPANLMYLGVLAVGVIGASITRFQPKGMQSVLLATALAQTLVAVITLGAGIHIASKTTAGSILMINGVFVALWMSSAWLFRQVAQKQASAGAAQEG